MNGLPSSSFKCDISQSFSRFDRSSAGPGVDSMTLLSIRDEAGSNGWMSTLSSAPAKNRLELTYTAKCISTVGWTLQNEPYLQRRPTCEAIAATPRTSCQKSKRPMSRRVSCMFGEHQARHTLFAVPEILMSRLSPRRQA